MAEFWSSSARDGDHRVYGVGGPRLLRRAVLASWRLGVPASWRPGVLASCAATRKKEKPPRREAKKSRRRPTLARASPALPSAMEPLTSVFGMGTGVTAPLWPPAKNRKLGTKETYNPSRERDDLTSSEVRNIS